MKLRRLLMALPLGGAFALSGVMSHHTALAANQSLHYFIENDDYNVGNAVWMDGPPGSSSGTPAYVEFECGYNYQVSQGWTISGTAAVKNFASYADSRNSTRAPAVVNVTLTNGSGDTVRITGADVANNSLDELVSGSFRIVETYADGDQSSCIINQTGASTDAENEMFFNV